MPGEGREVLPMLQDLQMFYPSSGSDDTYM